MRKQNYIVHGSTTWGWIDEHETIFLTFEQADKFGVRGIQVGDEIEIEYKDNGDLVSWEINSAKIVRKN